MSYIKTRRRTQFVYKTTNLLNGTYYIGVHSTWNIDDGYLGSGKRLKRSIEKYGKENFKREILAFFETNKEAYEYESHLVNEELIKDELCMNLKPGGSGGFSNEEHQLKCSIAGGKAHSAKMKTDESYALSFRKKTSEVNTKLKRGFLSKPGDWRGKKHRQESIELMKSSSKGKGLGEGNSQFGTCWISHSEHPTKKIKRNDLDAHLLDGWQLGRTYKNLS